VFASAGKTEPPSRLILSQTSAGMVLRHDQAPSIRSLDHIPNGNQRDN
jgi:hypothetical protein